MPVTYLKSELGFEFPSLDGKLLAWDIGSHTSREQESLGYPEARVVIAAMAERRPEQLRKERLSYALASLNGMFGHNARKVVDLIDEVCPEVKP